MPVYLTVEDPTVFYDGYNSRKTVENGQTVGYTGNIGGI